METLSVQLIEAIQNRSWWPVVGIGAALLVACLRAVLPSYWESIPTRWKPVPSGALVLLAAIADAFTGGLTWQVALIMVPVQVLTAWPTAVGTADTVLRLSGTKTPSIGTLEAAAKDLKANFPPVSIVLLVALAIGLANAGVGCSFLRQAAPVAAGEAASRATLVCQALKGADRDTCIMLATILEENNELVETAVRNALEGQACPAPSGSASR